MVPDKVIQTLTLEEYLEVLNRLGANLVDDLNHWNSQGINTAVELSEYLDNEAEANRYDEPNDGYDYDKYY